MYLHDSSSLWPISNQEQCNHNNNNNTYILIKIHLVIAESLSFVQDE